MGVKSDKTFEEIVERLLAHVRPQADHQSIRVDVDEHAPSSPSGSAPPTNLSSKSTEDDAQ